MKVEIDTEFDGLGEVLADVLPAGVKPTSLRLTSTAMRLEARAPLVGGVALTALVESARGRMRLYEFDFEGASLVRRTVLGALREKLAAVDVSGARFRVKGEDDGASVVVTWA